jgi:DNA-directed RNA polymerase I, II, and III subunit RPABC2
MTELQEIENLPINDIEESDDEVNSLRSSVYGDSDDEDFVPPPPPPPESGDKSEDEDSQLQETDDERSLASESEPIENEQMDVYMDENEDDDYDEDEDSDEEDENYLQKFEQINKKELISNYHPELVTHNNDEVESLCQIVRNEHGVIIDPLHKTVPFLTKYERARVLGERAKQLNQGAKPLVEMGPEVVDGYLMALKEFEEKKIPFIVKRPMPNGGCEYWKFKDLEFL